jgi:peptidoglycan/LPS O-acetylase OafA/YrhL
MRGFTPRSRPSPGVVAHASIGARPALDGLRAVAVLAVVAYHLRYGWASGGFLGVDLFMVLSGFLITSLLIVEYESSGRVSLGAFWVRRFRRILPAVVLLLFVVSASAPVWASSAQRAALRGDGIASLTFWANWRLISTGRGYWAQFGSASPLTHFWSLAVEEQFYVVWPVVIIVVLLITRGHPRALLLVVLGGVLGSALSMLRLYDAAEPARAYLGTDTRLHTLLVGAAGALVLRPAADRVIPGENLIAPIGTAALIAILLAMGLVGDRDAWMYGGGFLLFAIAAMAVVAAAICSTGPVAQLLQHPLLGWIGKRSFGIYLWHWPLIVILTPDFLGFDGAGRDVVLVVATVLIAAASYQLVEQPIRRSSAVAQTVVVTLSASVVTVGVVIAATISPSTARVQLDPVAAVARPASVTVPNLDVPASVTGGNRQPALRGRSDVPAERVELAEDDQRSTIRTVLIQGDSVALFSSLPVVEAFAAAGLEAINLTEYGQSLADPSVLEALATSGAQVSVWQISLWDVGDDAVQRSRYQAFVDASVAAGMDVIFIDQPPVLESLETDERLRIRRLVRDLAAATPDRVSVLDPEPVWGRTVDRDRDEDGVPERWADEIHVCPQGSARWTAWLLSELAARYRGIEPADPSEWINGAWLDDPRWQDSLGQCDP